MGDEQRQLNEMCNSFGWRYATYLATKTTTTTYMDTSGFVAGLIDAEFALMRDDMELWSGHDPQLRAEMYRMTDHTFRMMIHNLARMICQSVSYLKTDELTKSMLEAYGKTVVANLVTEDKSCQL